MRGAVRHSFSAALVLAVVLGVATQAVARQTTATNLVRNGDAEASPGATTNDQVIPPPGWTTTGKFTALEYGPGGPVVTSAQGKNYFAGGSGTPVSTATQTIDVSASAAAIDAGGVQATLSALLGGWEYQEDSATVTAVFVDASGAVLDDATIGPVSAEDRANKTILLPRSKTVAVPPRTRAIRVVIECDRASGIYNDGYADNVSLTLSTSTQPARGRYAFGFRIFDRQSDLSAGTRGTFDTSGQPDSTGDLKVVKVAARDLVLSWRYRGGRYNVTLRFRGTGSYAPGENYLSLWLRVKRSNFSSCKVGSVAYVTLDRPGDVVLNFCGDKVEFMAPARASAWIKPR